MRVISRNSSLRDSVSVFLVNGCGEAVLQAYNQQADNREDF